MSNRQTRYVRTVWTAASNVTKYWLTPLILKENEAAEAIFL